MRETTRRERKEIARMQRRESLRDGSYFEAPKKRCRNRSLTLSLAMVLFIFALLGGLKAIGVFDVFSFSDERVYEETDKETLFAYEELLLKEYRKLVHTYNNELEEDKRLEDVIHLSDTEISLKQVSTEKTRSLISAYLKDGKVTKVATIGIYDTKNHRFAMGFKENMILTAALVLRTDWKTSGEILATNGVFSDQDLFLKPRVFEYEDKEFVFHIVDKNKFYFSISNKKPLVSR